MPVAHGTRAPVNPAVSGDGGATHANAVAALDRLAAAAADAQPLPVPMPENKALYVKTYNLQDGAGRYVHEVWLDPSIATPLRIRRTDGATTDIDDTSSQAEIDQGAGEPPSIWHPVPAYYNSLPADPAALLDAWYWTSSGRDVWLGRASPGRHRAAPRATRSRRPDRCRRTRSTV
ncbi:hypothetical protein [Dactylosporangium fulvum]|uniref:PepSY domain-containing protein n=1 Tax=Dactylosporangium fulvum TaxID=53359 RepID=A0ABY5VVS9_9ACTN|nr:hypothetical protein [Dactylosporangium fulvum]UWP81858.1 hypothetical protein Dfulv_43350 [Dactylosporangium fulvum]